MPKALKSEPVAIAGFVNTALALVLAFGVKLSTAQVGQIVATVNAFLALVVRQAVTPQAAPPAPQAPPAAPPPAA